MATEHPFQLLFESFGRIPTAHAESVNRDAYEVLSKTLDVSVEAPGRCILLRAPRAGHGKTHLLSRIQHQFGGTHEFIPLHVSGTRVDALSVTEDALKRLSRPLPAAGGLTVLDLIIRRLFSFALQPLVISGEVPCQDREGALAALKTRPVETFDFHHPNAVTAHWAKENFDVLGPRLSMELSQRSGVAIREVSFWVTAFFHFASTPIDHPGRTSVLALEVAGETITEGIALERLFALLGMLSLLTRVALVADDLEGFSADETAALRFAAFVVAIRQAVDRVDVILSLNKDIWETAFLPRLSGGLADRLSEVLIELEPLKDEDIVALFESRAPGFGEQIKSRVKSEDRHARGLIRAAGQAWLSAAEEPEATPPVPAAAPVLQHEPVTPPPPPVSPPVFVPEPVQPSAPPEPPLETVQAASPPPPPSVFFPEESPAPPSPFQAVPPPHASPSFFSEEPPPAPPEPSVFQAVAPDVVPQPVATPIVAEPVFSNRPFESEFASPFQTPQVQGREEGAEHRAAKEQSAGPSWNRASVFDAQVVDEPSAQPFTQPQAFQPSLQAAPPAPEPVLLPRQSVFQAAPEPSFAPPPPPVFQAASAESVFQPSAPPIFQPAPPESPFQPAPQPIFQAPPVDPVFQHPAQSPFQAPPEAAFQPPPPPASVFAAAPPQQAAPSPFQPVFDSESDSGFTIPQGVAVPPPAPAASPFQAPPIYDTPAPVEQPAAQYAPSASPFVVVNAPPSAAAYGDPVPQYGGIPASFGPPAPPQAPQPEVESAAEPVKAAQEEGDRVDELLRQFRERYGRGGL